MAKVEISIDTSEQTIAVTVDGKDIGDVNDIYAHSGSYFGLDISLKREDLGDLSQVTRLVAADKEYFEGKGYVNTTVSEHEGMVGVADTDAITKCLSRAFFGNNE